jgi:hypothetical protein
MEKSGLNSLSVPSGNFSLIALNKGHFFTIDRRTIMALTEFSDHVLRIKLPTKPSQLDLSPGGSRLAVVFILTLVEG